MQSKESSKSPVSPTKKKQPESTKSSPDVNSSAQNEQTGEALLECSDVEWDASDEPYSAELLNVKKKRNRVSVFTGTEKTLETIRFESSPSTTSVRKETVQLHGLARLIQKSCEAFIENSTGLEDTELHIKLEFPDARNETPKEFL